MRVTIDIDERLLRRAMRLTGLKTRREVVHLALETLVRVSKICGKEAGSRAVRIIARHDKLFRRLA